MGNYNESLMSECIAAIAALPDVRVLCARKELPQGNARIDGLIEATIRDQPVEIVIEAKASGYPRDAEQASLQLTRYLNHADANTIGMLVAPSITDRAREVLKSKSIGYWDRSGSLYLKTSNALFDIERPAFRTPRSIPKSLFRGSASQVLHALLNEPDRTWKISDLSKCSQVAGSHVHQVLIALETDEYVERTGTGPATRRKLIDPARLLDEWAKDHSMNMYSIASYYLWQGNDGPLSDRVAEALSAEGVDYALTAVSGAIRRAPFVWQESIATILVPAQSDATAVLSEFKAQPVEDGANVSLLSTKEKSPLLFRRRVNEVWVASDVQIYLDLMSWPQRGKEQAEHLRKERMGY